MRVRGPRVRTPIAAWLAVLTIATSVSMPVPVAAAPASPSPVADPSTPPPAAPADTGSWGPLLDWGIQAKHMTLLSTGKVLVWSTGDNARVWDPSTGTFLLAPATFGDLHCAGQSTLADGRVVVVGGQDGDPHNGTNILALFDPISETWTQGESMTDLRWYATSTTLADGRVLATSGDAPDGTRALIPEVYDPVTDDWVRLTSAPRDQPLYPFMFVLPDGRVYDAGSRSNTSILDPTGAGSWTPGPTAPWSTSGYSESAVMYAPGKILRAGGGEPAQARAAVVDMTAATPAWRVIDPMSFARRRMNLTLLADGSVIAIGGTTTFDNVAGAVLPTEIWDPVTEDWTTVESLAEPRMYHSSAVLLPDGRIVVGGGEAAGRLRAQIYSPPYLFKGPRPTITSSPATAAYGQAFQVTSPEAAAITSVALLRPAAATHALDMNQRYVPLSFTSSGTTLTVTGPASGGVAPPGDYLLIVKDAAGVPSVAEFVRVDTAANLQPGSVSGQVTEAATGSPVVGATVTVPGGSSVTGTDGRYLLSGLPAGDVVITYAAAGFAQETRRVTVVGGSDVTQDVAMAPPGRVVGTVTDAGSGTPIAGATVTFPGGVTTTDATGRYAVDGLPAGSRSLSFAATGFQSQEATVTVVADGEVTLDASLTATATWVSGEVFDAVTEAPLAGATVVISTGQTTTTDAVGRYRVDLPPGSYTVTATAPGHESASGSFLINGGSYATLNLFLPPSAAPTTFAPVADAYIKSNSPTTNYGTDLTLRLRADGPTLTNYESHLRFDVRGLGGRTVSSATLRLYVTDAGPNGGAIHRTTTPWTESGVRWSTAPGRDGAPIAVIGPVTALTWVDVPLAHGTVTGDGLLDLTLVGHGTNSVYYASRESANAPELRLVLGSGPGPTPTPTPAPTATPAPTPTASPTPTATPAPTPTSTPAPTPTATPTPPSGAPIRTITFEGGLLHPTTGVDSISGAVLLDTNQPIGGTASARVTPVAGGYLQESFPLIDDVYVRMRIRLTGPVLTASRILMISGGGTTTGNLTLQPTGRLRLRVGSTTIGADSAPLAVGTTYTIAVHQRRGTGANGVVEAFVVPDASPIGSPFASRTTGDWTIGTDRTRFGATTSTADYAMDDLVVASGAMPAAPLADLGVTILAMAAPMGAPRINERAVIPAAPEPRPRWSLCLI